MAALFVPETKPSTPSSPPRDFSTPLRNAQPEAIDAHYHAMEGRKPKGRHAEKGVMACRLRDPSNTLLQHF